MTEFSPVTNDSPPFGFIIVNAALRVNVASDTSDIVMF